jgi:ubiquinone/menaquinone biosynthesis C-methylase UbiE
MQKQDFADLFELEEKLWWFLGMKKITRTFLDSECLENRLNKALDVGCGTGGMLTFLSEYLSADKIFGLDFSPDALGFCVENGHKNLTQATATNIPFADNSFDLVTSFDVLVQIPGEKSDETAIAEMFRVLRPNGTVFIRLAAYNWMKSGHDIAVNSQRRYTLSEVNRKMQAAGFEVLRISYANSFLLPIAVLHRLILKKIGLTDKGSDVKPLQSEPLNRLFTGILSLEANILKNKKLKFPFGLSVICLAKKN